MSRKADKSYMYYLFVLVKIKIRKSVGKNFGKFSSFAYFKDHTFWKNLGKISDVYNLSQIFFPVFHIFALTPLCDFFPKIMKVHNLSQILFPCFSYFVLTPPCELFSKNRKNRETKFGKDYAFLLFLNIISHAVSETIRENINTNYNFICEFCLHEHMYR